MEIPRHWRLRQQRYGLIGDIDEFGNPRFPPRERYTRISQEPRQEQQPKVGGGTHMLIFSSKGASMSSK